ncbi:hypothetical protein HHUSO_G7624 [Huso huso]|uniref:Uncharacterized protein n=1 Tax=Huso huso TaxID=61971 RepID=A0ABR0ZV91_HUSHU
MIPSLRKHGWGCSVGSQHKCHWLCSVALATNIVLENTAAVQVDNNRAQQRSMRRRSTNHVNKQRQQKTKQDFFQISHGCPLKLKNA